MLAAGAVLLAASAAGFLGGLLGIGGGTILVPTFTALLQALGVSLTEAPKFAVATSLASMILLTVGSVQQHARARRFEWRSALWLGLGGSATAWGFATLAIRLDGRWLVGGFGLFALFVAYSYSRSSGKPAASASDAHAPRSTIRLTLTGAFAGAIGSLFGVGGGIVAVPLQTAQGIPIHTAIANSSGMILLNALVATARYGSATAPDVALDPLLRLLPGTMAHVPAWLAQGYVLVPVALATGLFAFSFARWGARVAGQLSVTRLRGNFALSLAAVGLLCLYRALSA